MIFASPYVTDFAGRYKRNASELWKRDNKVPKKFSSNLGHDVYTLYDITLFAKKKFLIWNGFLTFWSLNSTKVFFDKVSKIYNMQ